MPAMLMTDEQLLKQIEAFLKKTDMPQTRFGLEAMSEGGLVKSLREGRSLSLKNADKVLRFMAGYRGTKKAA